MTKKEEIFAGITSGSLPEEFKNLKTPCYIIDESRLIHNLQILSELEKTSGCKVLLAQKAFSNFNLYPLISEYISGTEASGLFEARLGAEEMPGREVHVFCAAYREDEFEEVLKYSDHIVFNSPAQLKLFGRRAKLAGKSIGLRINPEHSTQDSHAIYDPCAPGSRLGTTREVWDREMNEELISMLDGLHFHTLCEQNSDDLKSTLNAVEAAFSDILPRMKWLNMGGGHHITRADYDMELLKSCIGYAREKWGVTVYLEPGEAVALNAGCLLSGVLDIVENNGIKTAILDTSAACHMPDVIEMPYTPPLFNAVRVEDTADMTSGKASCEPSDNPSAVSSAQIYRLAGPSCLSGDIIGEYIFPEPLSTGSLLLFGDMAIYTMCKNNTFNGMPLPDICLRTKEGRVKTIRSFGYQDFKNRLGE